MSEPGSTAPKVLVLHGYVAYLVIRRLARVQLVLMIFSPGTVKVPASSANAWVLRPFTLSTHHYDANLSGRRA